MPFWFLRRRESAFQKHSLPGEVGAVSLPQSLTVELEDESTLMAYRQDAKEVTLRFSSVSFVPKDGSYDAAREFVRKRAADKGLPYYNEGGLGIATGEVESEEDGVPLIVKFWEVAGKNTVVTVSATMVQSRRNSPAAKRLLRQMPNILHSIEITHCETYIESDQGGFEVSRDQVAKTPQQVRPFGPDESRWLERNTSRARDLSIKYGSGGVLDPDELDRIFSRWIAETSPEESAEYVAQSLGTAFGEFLADSLQFRWVVITDEHGSDCAVRHHIAETTAFPVASVQKRIEDGVPEFFRNIHLMITDHLRSSDVTGR